MSSVQTVKYTIVYVEGSTPTFCWIYFAQDSMIWQENNEFLKNSIDRMMVNKVEQHLWIQTWTVIYF